MTSPTGPVEERPWRVYAVLFGVAVVGFALKRPFGLFLYELMGKPAGSWVSATELAMLTALVVGCVLHRYSGLPAAPRLERLLSKDRQASEKPPLWGPVLLVGACCALIFLAAQLLQSGKAMPFESEIENLSQDRQVRLALLYPLGLVGAALSEELVFRFGIISALVGAAWFIPLRFAWKRQVSFWVANTVQAVLFGLAHVEEGLVTYPGGGLAAQVLTAPQTWGGLLLGAAFRRWGAEVAVGAHIATDIFIPVALGIARQL